MNAEPQLSLAERLAVLAVALMLTVPFLLPFDQPPIQSFYQEWLAAALGTSAFVLLAASTPSCRIDVPTVVVLPIVLIALIAAHALAGRLVFVQQGVIGALYLAWAGVMAAVGFRLRQRLGVDALATLLARSLVLGACVSALIGLLQYLDWTPAGWVIPAKAGRLQGNLGQANQFADYLFLGLVSTIFLAARGRLSRWPAIAALALILFAISFSGSRALVLYFALLLAGAVLLRWRNGPGEFGSILRWAIACVAAFVLVQALAALLADSASSSAAPIAGRLTADHGGLRLRIWHAALLMAADHPWIGVGFGGFAWQHFLLAPRLSPALEPVATDNAHNLLLHVFAEFGVAAGLACIAMAAAWLLAQRRAQQSPAMAWFWAALGTLLLHSGLEYPLWYAYFLGLFALLAGATWPSVWAIALVRAGRVAVAGIACAAVLALSLLWLDHRDLVLLAAERPATSGGADQALRSKLVSVYQRSLFPDFLVFALASGAAVDADGLDAKIALNATALRILPTPEAAYRQALLLALAGRQDDAGQAWDRAAAAYPQRERAILRAIESDQRNRFGVLLEYARQKTGKSP